MQEVWIDASHHKAKQVKLWLDGRGIASRIERRFAVLVFADDASRAMEMIKHEVMDGPAAEGGA